MIDISWEESPSGSCYIYKIHWDGKITNDPLYWGKETSEEDLVKAEKDSGTRWPPPFFNHLDADQDSVMDRLEESRSLFDVEDYVAKNSVTLALLEMIKLGTENPEEFSKLSGMTCKYSYRNKLIGILSELWD